MPGEDDGLLDELFRMHGGIDERALRNHRAIAPIDDGLLASPLEYLAADHLRIRVACNLLDVIAEDPHGLGRLAVASALQFFHEEFPCHVADEEEGLFPLIMARQLVGDNLDQALAALQQEHNADKQTAFRVANSLAALARGADPENEGQFSELANGFGESLRRHVLWENLIVLPFARRKLEASDLKKLSAEMAGRRGKPPPG